MLIIPWLLVGALPLWTSTRIRNKTWLGAVLLAAIIGLFKAFDYASHIRLEPDSRLLLLIGILLLGAKFSLALDLFAKCGRNGALTARIIKQCFMVWLGRTFPWHSYYNNAPEQMRTGLAVLSPLLIAVPIFQIDLL